MQHLTAVIFSLSITFAQTSEPIAMANRVVINGDRAIAECNAVARDRFGKGAYRAYKIELGYATMYLVPIESLRDPKSPGAPSVAVREFCRLYEGVSKTFNLSTVGLLSESDLFVAEAILKAAGNGSKIEHPSLQLTGGYHPTWVGKLRKGDKERWAILYVESGQVDFHDNLPPDLRSDVKELRTGDENVIETVKGRRKTK